MPDKKIRICIHAETWALNSRQEKTIEVDAEEWEDMSREERDEMCQEVMFERLVEWGYEEVKEVENG